MPALKNDKHERFCHEIMQDPHGAAGRAYERAGYKARGSSADVNASRLLNNAKVAARLKELQENRSERTEVDLDYVVYNLVEVNERCMQRSPVMVGHGKERRQLVDDEGRHVWDFNASGATRALELLGKHIGMFTDRSVSIDLSKLTDDELRRVAKGDDPVQVLLSRHTG